MKKIIFVLFFLAVSLTPSAARAQSCADQILEQKLKPCFPNACSGHAGSGLQELCRSGMPSPVRLNEVTEASSGFRMVVTQPEVAEIIKAHPTYGLSACYCCCEETSQVTPRSAPAEAVPVPKTNP